MNFRHGWDYNNSNYTLQSKSTTKEARKKRMARQRLLSFHHRRNSGAGGRGNQKAMAVVENEGENGDYTDQLALSSAPSSHHPEVHRNSTPLERRQGWKTGKNLMLLLQKILKQSDVANLGRIVLPKKDAEMYLPELNSKDGISIDMEDIGTSRVWNMRYRYWPNSGSRMYLLENTGDFVRSNGLEEGDFIAIYSDLKCGKYLIRGVKAPQQGGNEVQGQMA